MDASGENSILKKNHQNQKTRYENLKTKLSCHMRCLYTPNLNEIYSKNYAFPLPPPLLVEVLVFLYLGTEDTLSVNLYGFPAVLYYLYSSEIP